MARRIKYAGVTYTLTDEDLIGCTEGNLIMPYRSKATVGNSKFEPTPLHFAVQPEFYALVCRNIVALGGKVTFSVTKQGNLCVTLDHPAIGPLPDKSFVNEPTELGEFIKYIQEIGM